MLMEVELPGESKSFADIKAGECFAFTRKKVIEGSMQRSKLNLTAVNDRPSWVL
jgi:hypothetical protein